MGTNLLSRYGLVAGRVCAQLNMHELDGLLSLMASPFDGVDGTIAPLEKPSAFAAK